MSKSELRINMEHSWWNTPLIQGQASYSHFHILLLHLPRHICTAEAICLILWLYCLSCEFSHLLPNSHFFLSARSRAQNCSNLLWWSKLPSQSTSTSWSHGSVEVLSKFLVFQATWEFFLQSKQGFTKDFKVWQQVWKQSPWVENQWLPLLVA